MHPKIEKTVDLPRNWSWLYWGKVTPWMEPWSVAMIFVGLRDAAETRVAEKQIARSARVDDFMTATGMG